MMRGEGGRCMCTAHPASHEIIEAVWRERWGGCVVSPNAAYRPGDVHGLVLLTDAGDLAAIATWAPTRLGVEITTLDAIIEGHDYEAELLDAVERTLGHNGVRCATIITANDNLRAFQLYARRGYRLVAIHRDAMEHVRKVKPALPMFGKDGIPLCDLWEFEKGL